jgi:hypothetical protein
MQYSVIASGSVLNLKSQQWTKKLLPKYIGPYKVIEAHNQASTVKLELPVALEA